MRLAAILHAARNRVSARIFTKFQTVRTNSGTVRWNRQLAIWAARGGFQIHTNEIDPRRRALLREIGFAPTAFDAEFINDFLLAGVNIDCVLMNPPFSSNGERTENNSSKFGFRHVKSALERLKRGGKFGIVLGEASGLDTKTGNDFWSRLADRIEVKTYGVDKVRWSSYSAHKTLSAPLFIF